jgi:ubiquinone/menaquinone biosynthesis C-methylase UbiE
VSQTKSVSFERAAEFYDRTRGGLVRGRGFAARIAPELGDASRVLEIGVGTGLVALSLSELGFDVVGVDLAASMLAKARERVGARVAQADAAHLPIRTASRDAVVAVWLLHLAGDREGVLAEAARVLRNRGRLVVICADADYEMDEISNAIGDMRIQLGRTRDLPPEVIRLAGDAGFALVNTTHTEHWKHEVTPEETAATLERREMSTLWDLDDETWTRVVQPAIDRLRALPDQHRGRLTVASHTILVFEKAQ